MHGGAIGDAFAPAHDATLGRVLTRAALGLYAFGLVLDATPAPLVGSVASAFALALVGAGVLRVMTSGVVRTPSLPLLLATAFTAWCAVSVLWAYEPRHAFERSAAIAASLATLWAGYQVIQTKRDVDWLVIGYVLGCALGALLIWRSFLTGSPYIAAVQVGQIEEEFAEQRFSALGFDPNELALGLALSVPFVAYLVTKTTTRARLVALAYLPLALSGIALTGSRGGLIAAAVGIVFSLPSLVRRSPLAAFSFAALVAVGVGAVWLNPETWTRILSIREQVEEGTMGLRLPIWRAGLGVFLDHPVTGIGIGGFIHAVQPALGRGIVAHNTAVSVAAELGVPGVLLLFGAFGWVLVSAFRLEGRFRDVVVPVVMVWLIGAMALTYEYKKQTWFVLLLGCAVLSLKRAGSHAVECSPYPPPSTRTLRVRSSERVRTVR